MLCLAVSDNFIPTSYLHLHVHVGFETKKLRLKQKQRKKKKNKWSSDGLSRGAALGEGLLERTLQP